jgi:ferritin
MISKTMTEALNNQINAELFSSYLYLSMASYAAHEGMAGAANWFTVQAKEEVTHAQRFYNYVNSQGERVLLQAIDSPKSAFESLLAAFEETLAHEKKVTALINDLVSLARDEKDHATEIMLQWFVTEQVEEEESAADIVNMLKLGGNQGGALFMIDKELGARTFTPPADTAE